MARSRKIKVGQILSDADIQYVTEGVQQLFRESFPGVFEKYGKGLDDSVRFLSVSQKCAAVRESKGISIKEAAKAIGAPQYRLKDIEGGSVRNVQVPVLVRYIDFLGLKLWFGQWKAVNRSLAERLGLEPALEPKARPKSQARRKQ